MQREIDLGAVRVEVFGTLPAGVMTASVALCQRQSILELRILLSFNL
jgi:hypothetical protein